MNVSMRRAPRNISSWPSEHDEEPTSSYPLADDRLRVDAILRRKSRQNSDISLGGDTNGWLQYGVGPHKVVGESIRVSCPLRTDRFPVDRFDAARWGVHPLGIRVVATRDSCSAQLRPLLDGKCFASPQCGLA